MRVRKPDLLRTASEPNPSRRQPSCVTMASGDKRKRGVECGVGCRWNAEPHRSSVFLGRRLSVRTQKFA